MPPSGFRKLFQLIVRPPALEQEVDAELEFHFQTETERLVAAGMSPSAAAAEARRRFGDVRRTRGELLRLETTRRAVERRRHWLEDLQQDLRYALRGFRRQPGFALVAVSILGLGIGANATMFGLVDRLILRPPAHVREPDRLVWLMLEEHGLGGRTYTNDHHAWPLYENQRAARSYAGLAAFITHSGMPLGRGLEARKISVTVATASYFSVLGVTPEVGRFYSEDEDRAEIPVAVISFAWWQREFGGRTDVLGTQLLIGTQTYSVIGVAPRGFNGVRLSAVDAWVPFHAARADLVGQGGGWRTDYGWQWFQVLGRLRDGATPSQAAEEVTRVHRAAVRDAGTRSTDTLGTIKLAPVSGLGAPGDHTRDRIALWLLGVALVVLLIASANVANLLLARAAARRREISIRLALGVSRARLTRQLLAESTLLAFLAGLAGLATAAALGGALRSLLLPGIQWLGSTVDHRVAVVTATIALITGIMTGLVPALQGGNTSATMGLRVSGARDGPRPSRLRNGLLIGQAALSLVLLVGAGLFVRSLDRLVHLDTGYDPDPVAVAQVDLAIAGYPREAYAAFYDRLEERVRSLPEAERTAVAFTVPLRTRNSVSIRLMDRDTTPMPPTGSPAFNGVTPGFFETVGMRLLRGRLLTEGDRPGTEPVMVINQAMAEFYWPGREALGQCVRVWADSLPCLRVVGVVATARIDALQEPAAPLYYMPLAQVGGMSTSRALFARARSGNGADLVTPIRRIILEMGPNLPYPNVRAFQSLFDQHVQPWRLGATMFGIFGGLALLVACAGLYSVLSYSIAQRTREFGVRSALGASPKRLVAGVVRDGARSVITGLAVGAGIALLLGHLIAPLLVETSPRDPLVFAVVSLTLLAAGVLAALIPARRAMRANPIEALRSE